MIKVIDYTQQYDKPLVLALGFFDCMHRGHMDLVNVARDIALSQCAQCGIMTFSNNHFVQLGRSTKLIYTHDERLQIYANCNIDVVVEATFDQQFMQLTAEQYLSALVSNKNIIAIVCGIDHMCGSDRQDYHYIEQYCTQHGIECHHVEQISNANGDKISSTMVRQLLSDRQFDTVNALLCQPYHITGIVNSGRGVGRQLGFATANITVSSDKLLPYGVFAGTACLQDGHQYQAIINIGSAPTFGVDQVNVEAHLIGYHGNIYGQNVTIFVKKLIRDIIKFDTKQQLITQLQQDTKEALID